MADRVNALTLRSSDAAARWNFGARAATATLRLDAGASRVRLTDASGAAVRDWDDPFDALAWMASQPIAADQRWVGFIAYDFSRHVERLPAAALVDHGFPTFEFALCRATSIDAREPRRPRPERAGDGPSLIASARVIERSLSRDEYLVAARRALDYIAAGDVFQLNLAQRIGVATTRSPAAVWDALPAAAYGAFLQLDGASIVSNSPELFFRIEPRADGSRRIVNRPIKGTRPIGAGMREQLEASAKDRAELAMIVDLQRNDLGRVCKIGSVVVARPRDVETTGTVHHGVATIEGTLRRNAGFADVVRALFPCGSITGVPKVRAMQIIDELEPVARGAYCGAIGYLDANGIAEFNVAIRTMTMVDGVAHVSVGGGIVADSTPDAEYDETLVKARAMLDALGVDAATLRSLRLK